MATNLVSLVMQFLTPEMIGRVATALGLDRYPGPIRDQCRRTGVAGGI